MGGYSRSALHLRMALIRGREDPWWLDPPTSQDVRPGVTPSPDLFFGGKLPAEAVHLRAYAKL